MQKVNNAHQVLEKKYTNEINEHTLNIPDIESVKLDVCESSRNSATLIMKAKKQPNITMETVTQRVELSGALKSFGETAKLCPGTNNTQV